MYAVTITSVDMKNLGCWLVLTAQAPVKTRMPIRKVARPSQSVKRAALSVVQVCVGGEKHIGAAADIGSAAGFDGQLVKLVPGSSSTWSRRRRTTRAVEDGSRVGFRSGSGWLMEA